MAQGTDAGWISLLNTSCSNLEQRGESQFVLREMPHSVFDRGKSLNIEAKAHSSLVTGLHGYVWLVQEGWLFGLRTEPDGKLKTGELIGPRDLFGVAGMWSETSCDLPFYTLTPVKVVQVTTAVLEELCQTDSEVGDTFMRYMVARYKRILAELHRSTLLPLGPRIESFLGYVERRAEDSGGNPPPHLSESTLAWAVGAHPVSVCRAMRGRQQAAPRVTGSCLDTPEGSGTQ